MAMSSKPTVFTRRYHVSGRVQGVGFRWFVEREATLLQLRGWVRNRLDGSVEALAMGSDEQLSAFYLKLRQGPRAARVDEVAVNEIVSSDSLSSFRIEETW